MSACVHQGGYRPGDPATLRHHVNGLGSALVAADGGAPWRQGDNGPLFDSRARVASTGEMVAVESRYRIESGELFSVDSAQTTHRAKPGEHPVLVRQRLTQQLQSRIPVPTMAPVGVAYSETRQTVTRLDADAGESVRRQMRLDWSMKPVALDMSWSREEGLTQPLLDCGLQGSVRFTTFVDNGPQLQLGGRSCEVFAPRLPQLRDAHGWSAALNWPQASEQTTLRLLTLQPQFSEAGVFDVDPAYELGLTRVQRVGRWRASGKFAMRRSSATPARDPEQYWLADASLRRRVRHLDLTASYRTGAGEDWFLPLDVDRVESMALGVDASHWFDLWLPAADIGFALTYRWQERERARGQTVASNAVHGKLSWSW